MEIVVQTGTASRRTSPVVSTLVVGRGEECDLTIDDPKASRSHARFSLEPDGRVRLEDLGSTNGTFVNGVRIAEPLFLRGGEQIRIADTVLLLRGEMSRPTVADVGGSSPTVGDEGVPHRERTVADSEIGGLAPAATETVPDASAGPGRGAPEIPAPPASTIPDTGGPSSATVPDEGAVSAATLPDIEIEGATVPDVEEPGTIVAADAQGPLAEEGEKGRSWVPWVAAALALVIVAVFAFVVLTSDGNGGREGAVAESGEDVVNEPGSVDLEPRSLRAITADWGPRPSSWKVELRWLPPDAEVDAYAVYRDGQLLEEDVTDTMYVDAAVEPATRYSYEVVAFAPDGTRAGQSQRIRTPTLSPRDGRLHGRYALTFTSIGTNTPGYYDKGYSREQPWRFDAGCYYGPCDVTAHGLEVVAERGTTTTLAWRGGRSEYAGVYEGFWGSTCRGRPDADTLRLSLKPVRSQVTLAGWTVTVLKGTATVESPADECRYAVARFTVQGVRTT